MADDCGRVNPVSSHYLNRDVREELYPGRQSKKHAESDPDQHAPETVETAPEETEQSVTGFHIDLRI